MDIAETLRRLLGGSSLDSEGAEALFESIFAGRLNEAQIASALSLMQCREPTVVEIASAARVMRRHAHRVEAPADGVPLVDTAGTGGTRKIFNVSTASAIVAVAAAPGRVRIAKHGNRSRTGRGSAEVMAALGVNIEASAEVQARCLRELGVSFSFAVQHHPAARHAAGVRKSLGFPTIFNLVGPLTNPAGATRQVMGVYAQRWVEPIAQVLLELGAERALVLHSEDGLDEISLGAPTRVAEVHGGKVGTWVLDPRTLGLAPATIDELEVHSLEEAADVVRRVLHGERGPRAETVAIATAATLLVADAAADLGEGLEMARRAMGNGSAARTLSDLVRISNER